MISSRLLLYASVATADLLLVSQAHATLTTFESYTGDVGLSSDGCGTTGPSCNLVVNVPTGSTVLSAILYTSTYNLFPSDVSALSGTLSSGSQSTGLTYTALPPNASADLPLDAGRDDVTSLLKSVVGNGSSTPYTFNVTESNTGNQDGEGLFVIYSNPKLATASVGLIDGAASSTGDMTSINFANPINTTAPGFMANLRVADGFSFDQDGTTNQESSITVDGGVLTNNAGNCDDGLKVDGSCGNGDLITVGGDNDPEIGPNLAPAGDPTALADDHENYDISSLITPNSSTIAIDTMNTSLDDNIFALAVDVSGDAGFNAPPPSPVSVPEPSSLALLSTLLFAGAIVRRKRRTY